MADAALIGAVDDMYRVAFTPKGGCVADVMTGHLYLCDYLTLVAFTPKGGCVADGETDTSASLASFSSSIHPQGWVCGGRMGVATHSASRARRAVPLQRHAIHFQRRTVRVLGMLRASA